LVSGSQGARRSHMGKPPLSIFILGSFMLIDNQFTNTTSAATRGSWRLGGRLSSSPWIQNGSSMVQTSNLPVTTVSFVLPGDDPGLEWNVDTIGPQSDGERRSLMTRPCRRTSHPLVSCPTCTTHEHSAVRRATRFCKKRGR
jgi:hypothetical protein